MIAADLVRVITMELFAILVMELEKLTRHIASSVTMSDLFLFGGNLLALFTVLLILIYLWRE
tara:strand:- start:342 stop:527 length:186 start_codon:yes stop_codon:yes gene_type:complete